MTHDLLQHVYSVAVHNCDDLSTEFGCVDAGGEQECEGVLFVLMVPAFYGTKSSAAIPLDPPAAAGVYSRSTTNGIAQSGVAGQPDNPDQSSTRLNPTNEVPYVN